MARTHSTERQKIRAYDYLRKSTKGIKRDKNGKPKEKQERSLEQQREELDKLRFPYELEQAGFDGYEVVGTHTDEGVSGWKLGNKRPGFQAMIHAIQADPAKDKVIRVDNIDRFSRADIDETLEVARQLKKAGVGWIVSAAQGVYAIGSGDLSNHLKFTIAANASHEYSKQLGRRITLYVIGEAKENKRNGGVVPFGLKSDGDGGLVPGDDTDIATVRLIFHLFADRGQSTRAIAIHLNESGISAPRGGRWRSGSIGKILRHEQYIGRFTKGSESHGRFFHIGPDGECGESDGQKQKRHEPVYATDGVYESIIDRKTWDAAQRRLASFEAGRKPRRDGYALSRILRCAHCGEPLVGRTVNGGTVVYRCDTSGHAVGKACGNYQIREDVILPAIMRMLDEQISGLLTVSLLPAAPTLGATRPNHEARIAKLQQKINKYVAGILDIDDAETRQECDAKIKSFRAELAALRTEQNAPIDGDAQAAQARFLTDWWERTKKTIVNVELPAEGRIAERLFPAIAAEAKSTPLMPWCPGTVFRADFDRRSVNEALHTLGCEVELRWRTEQRTQRKRYCFDRGRIRLGQRAADVVPIGERHSDLVPSGNSGDPPRRG